MFKRIASLLIVLVLCVSIVPQAVYATVTVPTEEEAYRAMITLQYEYPEGMPWTNDNSYVWHAVPNCIYTGYGCVAFAFILSDAAFGNLPAREIYSGEFSFEDIRVGDILRINNDTHSVIVLETHSDHLVLAEGNYNSSIHWGRTITESEIMSSIDYLWTRYPGAESDAGGSVGSISWSLDANGVLTISGIGDMPYCAMEADVAWSDYTDEITSVVIEDGITSIGPYAFMNCLNLTEVTIPASVTVIHKDAFNFCKSLQSVTIPDSVQSIGLRSFYLCENMQTLDLGAGVQTIANDAFNMCRALEGITIPASVTELSNYAFASCESLATITFEGDMPTFSGDVFSGVGLISNVTCYYPADNATWSGMEQYGGRLTWQAKGAQTELPVLPPAAEIVDSGTCGWNLTWTLDSEGTLTISGSGQMQSAPWERYKVKTIIIEDGVMSIAKRAFAECISLEEIVIPNSVLTIGNGAFTNCTSLTSIVIPESVTTLGESVFEGCTALTNIELSPNITDIGIRTFANCTSLTGITLPEGILTIEEELFMDCTSLKNIDIPDSVRSIQRRAFYRCTALETVNFSFSAELSLILEVAFGGCTSLRSVNFPAELSQIHAFAFSDCTNLTEIIFRGDKPSFIPRYSGSPTEYIFDQFRNVTATAYYPADNDTWTTDVMQDYDGDITWVAHTHTWDICTNSEKCMTTYTCTECGTIKTEFNHVWEKIAGISPTCTQNGENTYTCTLCGESKTEIIRSTGHDLTMVKAKAPTCTEDGYTSHQYCSVCDHTTYEVIPATGHTWGEPNMTPATCTESGEKTYTCTVCGETKTEPIPATGHTEVIDAGMEATCTEDGLTEGEHCATCGEVYVEQQVIPATGHTEVIDAAVDATCTENGLTEGKHCSVCNEVLVAQEIIPATGHTWGEWVTTVEPTEEADGTAERECNICGVTDTKVLPKKPAFKLGDVNGDGKLNAKDATAILKKIVGKLENPIENFDLIADVNKDGKVNAKDATKILKVIVGKDTLSETVEITKDNWQEYFEFKDVGTWDEGAFEDVKLLSMDSFLCVKDAYADRIVWDDFNVAMQITETRYPHSFVVNFSDKTITRTPNTETESGEVLSFSFTAEECRGKINCPDGYNAFVSLGGWAYEGQNISNVAGNTWSGTLPAYVLEISQIKGTLTIIIN